MVENISKKILYFLGKDLELSDEKREVLLFGITRIVEDIPKTIGMILIGILLNILYEMLIVTVILLLYKTFVGGVHAKTNLGCFASSVIFYLSIIYLAKVAIFGGTWRVFIIILDYVFALYCIWVYVPADVPEIPKVDQGLRKCLKIKSLIMLNLIFIFTFIFLQKMYIQNLILLSIFGINLMTTRSIYKLFKSKYGFETYYPYSE